MTSPIFHSKTPFFPKIEKQIAALLNHQPDFLTSRANSPRAVGDAMEGLIAQHLPEILGKNCKEFMPAFARRAMADVAFIDSADCYHNVDVKTHRLDASFSMPNLTSVQRIAKLYEDDSNYFTILLVSYLLDGNNIQVKQCHFVPIEFLSWECLTVGALGWGQIQIANANRIIVNPNKTRKEWMLELCDVMLEFYPKEIAKITGRIIHFEELKAVWQQKP